MRVRPANAHTRQNTRARLSTRAISAGVDLIQGCNAALITSIPAAADDDEACASSREGLAEAGYGSKLQRVVLLRAELAERNDELLPLTERDALEVHRVAGRKHNMWYGCLAPNLGDVPLCP